MKKLTKEDVVQNGLYWLIEYQGSSKPESRTLVRIATKTTDNKGRASVTVYEIFELNIRSGNSDYSWYEEIDEGYIEREIRYAEEQQQRLQTRINILAGLQIRNQK